MAPCECSDAGGWGPRINYEVFGGVPRRAGDQDARPDPAPSIEVEFLVESRALAKKLQVAGLPVTAGDIKRTDTYMKADISPQTCIIIEDGGR